MKLGQRVWVAVDGEGHLANCPEGVIICGSEEQVADELQMWSNLRDGYHRITEVTIQELEYDESW